MASISASLRQATENHEPRLSNGIQSFFDVHKQSGEQLRQKEQTRMTLEEVLKVNLGPDVRVHIVGSSLTEFASTDSELDLVLTKNSIREEKVNEILRLRSGMDILEFRNGPTVKVPIIRGRVKDGNIQWGMSFNKTDNIVKAKLLRAYSLLDPRVAPLVVVVKEWAKQVGVRDAHEGTLSSFSWTLMVICYLQCVQPPVLPCLQTMDRVKYKDVSFLDISTLDVTEPPPVFVSENTRCLGDLLKGFFDLYANTFKYESQAVSIRQGRLLSKDAVRNRPPPSQWKFFCIEEPYGDVLTNTARAMFKPQPCQTVVSAIKLAHSQLSTEGTLPYLNL